MQSRPLFVVRHIRQRGENTRQKEPDHKIFAVSNYCECSDDMTLIVDRCWEVIEAELQNESSTLPCKLDSRGPCITTLCYTINLPSGTFDSENIPRHFGVGAGVQEGPPRHPYA